ncbi:hypothetical protein [Salinigranum marinum]|uniref:hypothetical protein n=1 Tax=Salinigranum marinum TaxID=1515595 RepID=UPI002989CF2D|nr:hypothetical protein [Salinigranum marinum]
MSFEPTDTGMNRPTTDVQPLVPILPDRTPATRDGPTPSTTDAGCAPPRRTDYATPYTRHREAILPGVAPRRRD